MNGRPIDRSLPHRHPALMVTGTSVSSDRSSVSTCVISSDHPAVRGGQAPILMAVEMAAQVAGLHVSGQVVDDPEPESPRRGYLVSVQNVEFEADSVPADQVLDVRVELQASFGPLSMFRFVVSFGGSPVATGSVGVAVER